VTCAFQANSTVVHNSPLNRSLHCPRHSRDKSWLSRIISLCDSIKEQQESKPADRHSYNRNSKTSYNSVRSKRSSSFDEMIVGKLCSRFFHQCCSLLSHLAWVWRLDKDPSLETLSTTTQQHSLFKDDFHKAVRSALKKSSISKEHREWLAEGLTLAYRVAFPWIGLGEHQTTRVEREFPPQKSKDNTVDTKMPPGLEKTNSKVESKAKTFFCIRCEKWYNVQRSYPDFKLSVKLSEVEPTESVADSVQQQWVCFDCTENEKSNKAGRKKSLYNRKIKS